MPTITVLMAVHNGEAFLAETLRSVQAQSFADFEFLIIDDASTDGSGRMVSDAARADRRIRIVRNDRNLGLTRSLNIGLEHAVGDYIARIDADDVCLLERLARQHAFLEKRGDHVAVACGFEVIDEAGRRLRRTADGLDDWQVRWLGGFNPPAPHPTYFFRRVGPDGSAYRYDERFRTAQDFDLWSRFMAGGKTAVLPDVLVHYRRHAGAITLVNRHEQALNCADVGRRNLTGRLPPEIAHALEPLLTLFSYQATASHEMIAAAVAGCDAMLAHDLPLAPSPAHRAWLRTMTAGLVADAILSRGGALRRPASLLTFLFHARGHLPFLARAVAKDPALALKSLRSVRQAAPVAAVAALLA